MWEKYSKSLALDDEEKRTWLNRIERVNNKLSSNYYQDKSDRMLMVGSVGRETAISKTSDYDVIYVLPQEVYTRFSKRKGNIQSALLQEVKDKIKETYPQTIIRGDGQVVVVEFRDGKLEVLPAFLQTDEKYKYPDSNNGGRWRYTDPRPEIKKAKDMQKDTDNVYNYCCYLLRKWKNYQGFPFKGLLIDTMVCNFLEEKDFKEFKIERDLLKKLFLYLSKQDREAKYWKAMGSGQHISNDDEGEFIKESKKAYDLFEVEKTDEELMHDLFGYNEKSDKAPQENYIDETFNIDISYRLNIFCTVKQPGFVPKTLMEYSKSPQKHIKTEKSLLFEIKHNIPRELKIDYYWKVRNRGPQSKGKERGNIFKGNYIHRESTSFPGPHYVECYAVSDGVVIARDRIHVPID